jgi:hypothetical protein
VIGAIPRVVYVCVPRIWVATMFILVACLVASIVIATVKLA